ncbi:hypothetical protein OSB04_013231 [Centaurea solstitialis]|uniref:Uncharacterized protein n=1 Tax=Centaurea solstitialis TaxID=347529 RepID=A0AA38WFA8_9ASTR|nr:hypothetical protein OSB04_013231 [Centaurea solstitialis]
MLKPTRCNVCGGLFVLTKFFSRKKMDLSDVKMEELGIVIKGELYNSQCVRYNPQLIFLIFIGPNDVGVFPQKDVIPIKKQCLEIKLINSSAHYELPSHVYSCLELRILTLENDIFKTPLEFGRFSKLEYLYLKILILGPYILVSLPQPSRWALYRCTNIHNFNIESRNLHKFFFFLSSFLFMSCISSYYIG